tara:strand:+ start:119922 stop:123221 length:3300 start_codon:yes stop_codon:yes gene_type:complete
MKYLIYLLIFISSLTTNAGEYSSPFSLEQEFPAYFSDADDKTSALIRQEIEQILQRRFEAMTVPVPSEGGLISVNYFEWAKEEARKLNLPDALRFYPSGGLIRNNIGLIYEHVHRAKSLNPKASVLELLRQIKSQTPSEISHTKIRGVGSDLDILVSGLSEPQLKVLNESLEKSLTQFEVSTGMRSSSAGDTGVSALKKAFLVIPDFKDLDAQILRSAGQGGLESDFLFYDMENQSLKAPPEVESAKKSTNAYLQNYKGAVERLLEGSVRYHPPYNLDLGAATDSQAVRALRTLSETAWVNIDDFQGVYTKEVNDVVKSKTLSPKASDQLKKMIRNSRFGGAANRFSRPSNDPIAISINKLKEAFPKGFRLVVAIDSLTDLNKKLAQSPDYIRNALVASADLPKQFYHGLPQVEDLQSVVRNGLFVSLGSGDGTTALQGAGAYATNSYEEALNSYAKKNGVVIPIQLTTGASVLDLSQIPEPELEKLQMAADKKGIPLNLYLHDTYGVSAVRGRNSKHILLLNSAAIEEPVKSYKDILKVYVQNLYLKPKKMRTFSDLVNVFHLAKYAEISGEKGIMKVLQDSAGDKAFNLEKAMRQAFGQNPADDLRVLLQMDERELPSSVAKRVEQHLGTEKFKRAINDMVWPKGNRLSRSAIEKLKVGNLPERTGGPLNELIWKEVESALVRNNRFRILASADPENFYGKSRRQGISDKVLGQVYDKLKGVHFPRNLSSRYLAVGGELTALGRLVLRDNPQLFVNTLKNKLSTMDLSKVDIPSLKILIENGLPLNIILRSAGPEVAPKLGIMGKGEVTFGVLLKDGSEIRLYDLVSSETMEKLKTGERFTPVEKERIRTAIKNRLVIKNSMFSRTENGRAFLSELKKDPSSVVRSFANSKRKRSLVKIDSPLSRVTKANSLQVKKSTIKDIVRRLASAEYDIDLILNAVSDSSSITGQQLREVMKESSELRALVRGIVVRSGSSQHTMNFPWNPQDIDDQRALARMQRQQVSAVPRVERRLRQLAQAELKLEKVQNPTQDQISRRVEVLKQTSSKAQEYLSNAHNRATRELPEVSPSVQKRLDAFAVVDDPPDVIERGKASPDICP